jgi:hypothetical protein
VIHEDVRAGRLEEKFDDRRAAGRHERGLDVVLIGAGAALGVDAIENLADDVERPLSPTLAVGALSPTCEPTEPLKTT